MATSSMSENRYHVRSTSMPSRSHPSAEIIEEELIKLRSWKTISKSSTSSRQAKEICNGLSSLGELYNCVEDLLHLPLTQQELAHQEHEMRENEVLDDSLRLLDMCSTTRDTFLSMKEHMQNLQSTLRRRRAGELRMEKEVHAYMCFRKKVKKEAAKAIISLKQMNAKSASSPPLDQDHHLSMVVKSLKEVTVVTISIFQSLFVFLSAPRTKTRTSTWSLVSNLMSKSQVGCEESQEGASATEVESLENILHTLSHHESSKDKLETVQMAQQSLKAMEASIIVFDAELECLFRHLIQTRVSILNILTH